jgi:hypothetical protein
MGSSAGRIAVHPTGGDLGPRNFPIATIPRKNI